MSNPHENVGLLVTYHGLEPPDRGSRACDLGSQQYLTSVSYSRSDASFCDSYVRQSAPILTPSSDRHARNTIPLGIGAARHGSPFFVSFLQRGLLGFIRATSAFRRPPVSDIPKSTRLAAGRQVFRR